jgi:CelD/BcsL family acetyltransferase involved in cellulose biosynthesis
MSKSSVNRRNGVQNAVDFTAPSLCCSQSGAMLSASVSVYSTFEAFEYLKDEWNKLHDTESPELFFMSNLWQQLCWKYLSHGKLQIITVRTLGGLLCGIMPLWIDDTYDGPTMRLVGAEDVSDYLDMVTLPGLEEFVTDHFLRFLLYSPEAPYWSKVKLEYVPDSSATPFALCQAAKRYGLCVVSELQDVCPVVPLPSTFAEYLSSLNVRRRRSLIRKRRVAEARGTCWYKVVQGSPQMKAELDFFLELLSESHGSKGEFFSGRGIRNLLTDLLLHGSGRQQVELVILLSKNDKSAAALQFAAGNRIMFYNSARCSLAEGSPGIVLLSYCIEDAICRGFKYYDFLRGEEDYKYRLGGVNRSTYLVSISRSPR